MCREKGCGCHFLRSLEMKSGEPLWSTQSLDGQMEGCFWGSLKRNFSPSHQPHSCSQHQRASQALGGFGQEPTKTHPYPNVANRVGIVLLTLRSRLQAADGSRLWSVFPRCLTLAGMELELTPPLRCPSTVSLGFHS